MIYTSVFPGRYIQGFNALVRLGKELRKVGQKCLALCDPVVHEKYLQEIRSVLEGEVQFEVRSFSGECCDEEIEKLAKVSKGPGYDIVVGFGGGQTLDTAKALSLELNCPVATCPTAASTDAPTTSAAVIHDIDGKIKKVIYLPRNPVLVIVDTRIIAEAPVRLLVAGMGDALSTWFEAESHRQTYAPNLTGDHGLLTAFSLSRLCYDILLQYGVEAKACCEQHVVTPALEHVVEANTLLSGLGCENAGLSAAHSIADGFNGLQQTVNYYHGEKVAVGTLTSLFLTDKPKRTIDEVYEFCESVELPTTLSDIGLGDMSDEELTNVAENACKNEDMHNEPVPVTPDSVFFALKAMDSEGRNRKQRERILPS
jgi:glycerol dehydrogenase